MLFKCIAVRNLKSWRTMKLHVFFQVVLDSKSLTISNKRDDSDYLPWFSDTWGTEDSWKYYLWRSLLTEQNLSEANKVKGQPWRRFAYQTLTLNFLTLKLTLVNLSSLQDTRRHSGACGKNRFELISINS